jgi:hypothetical protein
MKVKYNGNIIERSVVGGTAFNGVNKIFAEGMKSKKVFEVDLIPVNLKSYFDEVIPSSKKKKEGK